MQKRFVFVYLIVLHTPKNNIDGILRCTDSEAETRNAQLWNTYGWISKYFFSTVFSGMETWKEWMEEIILELEIVDK